MIPIGTPGCYSIGSDTYPVTLVKQSKSGKVVWVEFDNYEADVEAGHNYFGNQVWKISRSVGAAQRRFDWSEKRQRYSQGGCGSVSFGHWACHMDPSF